jgi:hypothetical protein
LGLLARLRTIFRDRPWLHRAGIARQPNPTSRPAHTHARPRPPFTFTFSSTSTSTCVKVQPMLRHTRTFSGQLSPRATGRLGSSVARVSWMVLCSVTVARVGTPPSVTCGTVPYPLTQPDSHDPYLPYSWNMCTVNPVGGRSVPRGAPLGQTPRLSHRLVSVGWLRFESKTGKAPPTRPWIDGVVALSTAVRLLIQVLDPLEHLPRTWLSVLETAGRLEIGLTDDRLEIVMSGK